MMDRPAEEIPLPGALPGAHSYRNVHRLMRELPYMMCPHCGRDIRDIYKICPYCLDFVNSPGVSKGVKAEEWLERGFELGNLGRHQDALDAFGNALLINPNYVIAWYYTGLALHNLGREYQALEVYEKLLSIDPNFIMAWYNKGIALYDFGRYQDALEAYETTLALNPTFANAWCNKGSTLFALGRDRESLDAFEKTLTIDPNDAIAWNNKGGILDKLGRYQDALNAYEKALSIKPDYVKAWENKGDILDKLGRHQESYDAYKRARWIDPKYESSIILSNEIDPADFNSFIFNIGEQSILEVVPSEDAATIQLSKINTVLDTENGFYNEFSPFLHMKILWFIRIRYPNLSKSAFLILNKFKSQLSDAYTYFKERKDRGNDNQYVLGGIITDIFHCYEQDIYITEFLLNHDPENLKLKNELDVFYKELHDFLVAEIVFYNNDGLLSKMRNYDLYCWYYLNWLSQSPQIVSYDQKIDENLNELLSILKKMIKDRYGVS
jgi:lipoprotein NlpI